MIEYLGPVGAFLTAHPVVCWVIICVVVAMMGLSVNEESPEDKRIRLLEERIADLEKQVNK